MYQLSCIDLTIPITSFMYCLIGLFLIIRSARYYKLWSRAYNLKTVELLHDFFQNEDSFWHFLRIYFVNFRADEEVEFRILHRIFCDAYSIKDDAIDFDQYMILNHEKYLLGLVTISPLSWFILCGGLMLNYFRVRMDWNFFSCSSDHFTTHGDGSPTSYPTAAPSHATLHMFSRMIQATATDDHSATTDDHVMHLRHVCQAENILYLYSLAGIALLCFTVFLAFLARLYVRRMMATKGILSREDYAIFLQLYDVDENRAKRDTEKMDTKELSDALVTAKHAIDVERLDKKAEQGRAWHNMYKKMWVVLFYPVAMRWLYKQWTDNDYSDVYDEHGDPIRVRLVSFEMKKKEGDGDADAAPLLGGAPRRTVLHDARLNTHITSETISNMMELKRNSTKAPPPQPHLPKGVLNVIGKLSPANSMIQSGADMPNGAMSPPSGRSSKKRGGIIVKPADIQRLNLSHALKSSARSTHRATLADSQLVDAFLFKSPRAYFLIVDSMVMLISFYMGLWISNFDSTAAQVHDVAKWRLLTLLPGLLSAVVFGHMVFTCSLLHAIVILDREVVEETIEKKADSARVAQVLRDRLIEQLDGFGDADVPPEVQLRNLFNVIDEDNSKFLTREELQHFLQGIRISFTKRRWDQIFHEIDANFDDEITFDELLLFVFPHVNAGQEQERRRLQAIGGHLVKGLSHMHLPDGLQYQEAMERICFCSNLAPVDRQSLFQNTIKEKSAANLLAVDTPGVARQNSFKRSMSIRDILGVSGAARVAARSSGGSMSDASDKSKSPLPSDNENEDEEEKKNLEHDVENPHMSPSKMMTASSRENSTIAHISNSGIGGGIIDYGGISGGSGNVGSNSRGTSMVGNGVGAFDQDKPVSGSNKSIGNTNNYSRGPSIGSQKSDANMTVGARSRAASEAATASGDVLAFDGDDSAVDGVGENAAGMEVRTRTPPSEGNKVELVAPSSSGLARSRALTTTTNPSANNALPATLDGTGQLRNRAATEICTGTVSVAAAATKKKLAFDSVAAIENAEISTLSGDADVNKTGGMRQEKYSPSKNVDSGGNNGAVSRSGSNMGLETAGRKGSTAAGGYAEPEDMGFEEF